MKSNNINFNGAFTYDAIWVNGKENLKKKKIVVTEKETEAPGILGCDALRWVIGSGRFEGSYCLFFETSGIAHPIADLHSP